MTEFAVFTTVMVASLSPLVLFDGVAGLAFGQFNDRGGLFRCSRTDVGRLEWKDFVVVALLAVSVKAGTAAAIASVSLTYH